jgi:hypothetical protein
MLGRNVRWAEPFSGPLAAGAAERKNSEMRLGDARGTRRSNRPYRAHQPHDATQNLRDPMPVAVVQIG